mmetsp:Transcript_23187/g.53340  ORF Transcript_23187/g.53340 Transcript_23187/m.53340 type:complete len:420 (-) Transcript_23187:118-1377(-)
MATAALATPPLVLRTDHFAQDLRRELVAIITANAQVLAAQCAEVCIEQVRGTEVQRVGAGTDGLEREARPIRAEAASHESHAEFHALDQEVRAALQRSPAKDASSPSTQRRHSACGSPQEWACASDCSMRSASSDTSSPKKSIRQRLLAAVEEVEEASFWKAEAEDEAARLAAEFQLECDGNKPEVCTTLPPALQSEACVWQSFPEVALNGRSEVCSDLAGELESLRQFVAAVSVHMQTSSLASAQADHGADVNGSAEPYNELEAPSQGDFDGRGAVSEVRSLPAAVPQEQEDSDAASGPCRVEQEACLHIIDEIAPSPLVVDHHSEVAVGSIAEELDMLERVMGDFATKLQTLEVHTDFNDGGVGSTTNGAKPLLWPSLIEVAERLQVNHELQTEMSALAQCIDRTLSHAAAWVSSRD